MARANVKITPAPEPELSPAQERAIVELLAGHNQAQAAAAAEVAPETISRWKAKDPAFIAALNLRRRELYDAHSEHLRSLAGQAVDTIAAIMTGADDDRLRLQAALSVLKACGLGELAAPSGETTAAAVKSEQNRLDLFNFGF